MPKPSAIITTAAHLMNDSAQTEYTNAAVLPYLNIALNILQETFELNGVPVTNKTSIAITVPDGINKIGFDTVPSLPFDLIEIKELWESGEGLEQWIPLRKKDFIPNSLTTSTSSFRIWAWKNEHIELVAASSALDLKIDYIGSVFRTPILIANIDVNIQMTNIQTFLEFQTAALCALFIAENETRAMALGGEAGSALSRSLGIPIKGMQSIVTRRMPFRAGYKRMRGL